VVPATKISEAGTQSTISTLCGLARGNPQWTGILGLFRKNELPWFNFLMDLKEQSAKNTTYICGVNSQRKITILSIDWIQHQCYQKHGAGIGVSRALFKPV